jgi:ribosome-associated heat shock protein Hsp15
MRLDVALFELRLYKSRTAAQEAIAAGHVTLDGRRVKPSHGLAVGERVTLAHAGGARTLEVLALPRAGLSKEQAREYVREVG